MAPEILENRSASPSPARSALAGALAYAAIGVIWIVSSDLVLERFSPSAGTMATLQTWKGTGFVVVTSIGLYSILLRQFSRRAAEASRLRAATERLRSHVENTPLAVVEWDSDFRLVRWSSRARELFGWEEKELLGRTWTEWGFIVPEDRDEVAELVSRSLREGAPGSVSVNRNVCRDGSVVWCEWYNSWIRDSDGKVLSMMSLGHDITAEREAVEEVRRLNRELEARVHRRTEALAQANADLKGLTYSISHDLRTPVRAVLGFGEILQRRHADGLPEQGREYVDKIVAAGGQMNALIDGILEFGQIGVDTLEPRNLDPRPVIDEVLGEFAAARDIDAEAVEVDSGLPHVRADPGALRRIFQNLLGNAFKYGPTDGTLRVRVSGGRDSSGRPQLVVSDNGPGIPEEHREQVFELFQRLHSHEAVEGSGLGLAVVRRSMESMGGSVRVTSGSPGRDGGSSETAGAAFVLTFPTEQERPSSPPRHR